MVCVNSYWKPIQVRLMFTDSQERYFCSSHPVTGSIQESFLVVPPVPQSEKWKSLSRVRLFVTPWTIQSMKFSRPEYWVAFPFSRGSSQPRDWTCLPHYRWILYQLSHNGSPLCHSLFPISFHWRCKSFVVPTLWDLFSSLSGFY